MSNSATVEVLVKEIRTLNITIQELTNQVHALQINSCRYKKVPGTFKTGDRVVILTNGLIGKAGDKATVTKVGKRISVKVQHQHTNRSPRNLKHEQQ